MRKTKQARKPRKAPKKTRKPRKVTRKQALKVGQDVHAALLEGKKPRTPEGKTILEAFKKHPMAISDVEFEETPEVIAITMPKHRAASLAHDLSDLLCWWQGFQTSLALRENVIPTFLAQNGINAASDLNRMLKSKS